MNEIERARLRALWAAVLTCAVSDLLGKADRPAESAARWIFEPSAGGAWPSFDSVCDILDIDSGQVRSRCRKMLARRADGVAVRDLLPRLRNV